MKDFNNSITFLKQTIAPIENWYLLAIGGNKYLTNKRKKKKTRKASNKLQFSLHTSIWALVVGRWSIGGSVLARKVDIQGERVKV